MRGPMAIRGIVCFLAVLAARVSLARQDKSTDPDRPFALMVGDPAPALTATDWLKGDPVPEFQRGHIYIIDFWASWCTSCIAEFPDVSRVQDKYRDRNVTVIAVSRPDSSGCTLDEIRQILKIRGDQMRFAVAWDESLKNQTAWMKASGRHAIPALFVVDQNGIVAAIHARADFVDRVVGALLDGIYDLKRASADYRRDELAGRDTDRFIAKIHEKDYAGAYAFARGALKGPLDTCAPWLSVVAWESMDPHREKATWDLELAWTCAARADELVPAKDNADVLNTYARACFLTGRYKDAVAAQQRAIELTKAANGYLAEDLERLREYERALEDPGSRR